ncbi:MAG TPA: protein-L-isoaspartate(D-aspartate) O-methyltransferase, partial [Polyangia bacterium]
MSERRREMVERQIAARGIADPRVLAAMAAVPREEFVPPSLAEFAYDDRPLPIAEGQTISQPYVVAWMVEALELRPGDRVLEVGTGSGYAAAVIARLAKQVHTIERHASLAETAAARLYRLGFHNVFVHCGDGTLGLPDRAPFDAIVVAAGGPQVPDQLERQLAVGGRMVIPVGEFREQRLVRIRRLDEDRFEREDLGGVQFVPLVGAHGWAAPPARGDHAVARLLAEAGEPIADLEEAPLGGLLERIGDARVV